MLLTHPFTKQNLIMPNRRQIIQLSGAAIATSFFAPLACTRTSDTSDAQFSYCLNTSTISGQNPGLKSYIEIAARAGYNGIELWVKDIQAWLAEGKSTASLKKLLSDSGLQVESAIGFASWLNPDEELRKAGFIQMKEEMEILASIGCKRLAAPPAGLKPGDPVDLFRAGMLYRELLDLGRQTGVMPLLEFWGASGTVYHLGQVLMMAAVADDPEVKILPDVYHLFRGASGFEMLHQLSGNLIELFHLNDYPGDIPRTEQSDKDRVYPGDGVAPLTEILRSLKNMGGNKILSVELFNQLYWKQDPLSVATTALEKARSLVKGI